MSKRKKIDPVSEAEPITPAVPEVIPTQSLELPAYDPANSAVGGSVAVGPFQFHLADLTGKTLDGLLEVLKAESANYMVGVQWNIVRSWNLGRIWQAIYDLLENEAIADDAPFAWSRLFSDRWGSIMSVKTVDRYRKRFNENPDPLALLKVHDDDGQEMPNQPALPELVRADTPDKDMEAIVAKAKKVRQAKAEATKAEKKAEKEKALSKRIDQEVERRLAVKQGQFTATSYPGHNPEYTYPAENRLHGAVMALKSGLDKDTILSHLSPTEAQAVAYAKGFKEDDIGENELAALLADADDELTEATCDAIGTYRAKVVKAKSYGRKATKIGNRSPSEN
jgi:hypothetical protein